MRRRRWLPAVGVVSMAVALAGQVSGADTVGRAQGGGGAGRFQRLAAPAHPVALPPGLDPDREVTVVLQLGGRPVGLDQADARAQGRRLTDSDRAGRRRALAATQNALHDDIARAGGTVLAQWQDAYNGIKVRVAAAGVARLAALPGVVGVHSLQTFGPDNATSVPFIGAPAAWSDLGATGAGVKVAVIDTGIDYFHADFGGSGDPADFADDDGTVVEPGSFPTAKVVGGTDFVGDGYNAASDEPGAQTPKPDPDPKDCFGHGTHVAGTAAGFGVLADGTTYTGPYDTTTHANSFEVGPGVAPEALLYAYRVFGCEGSSNVVVDAINQAVADGVDVINMSLGSPFGATDDPTSVAADVAAQAGIVVVASAGNSGPNAYLVGSPSTTDRVISVAALDTVPELPAARVALPGGDVTVQNSNEATISSPVTGPLRVLRSAPGVISLGCEDADYASVQPGDVVVTLRGTCDRVTRAIKGQAAGASAVIMVNNGAGFPPVEGPIPGVTIPFLGAAGGTDGTFLAADGATVTVAGGITIANPTFRRIASFSSGGPRTGDSAVKPDVAAPGVAIISADSGGGTNGVRMSGTSMAAPHVSGVAALARQAMPSWGSGEVKAAVVNTADPSAVSAYNPRTAGSGLVQPRRVVDSVARATAEATGQPTLSFGYEPLGGAYSETLTLTLANDGASDLTYDLAAAFTGSSLGAAASVTPSSVTVPAGSTRDVEVTLSLSGAAVAALPAAEQAPGALVTARGAVTATPTTAGAGVYPLRVPFLLAPRGISTVQAGTPGAYTQSGGTFSRTVPLANTGIHGGTADVYAWGLSDPADAEGSMDLRAVGVQRLPGEAVGAPGDTLLVFAVNTFGRWSNAAGGTEVDLPVDLQHDGRPDFFVVAVDAGLVLTGSADGRLASFVFDATTLEVVDAFLADAPMNGSTMLLPVLASDLSLSDDRGHFTYGAVGYGLEGTVDPANGTGEFNAFLPSVSTGDFLSLAPGATASLTVSVDRGKLSGAPALGWMVVTMDDANGAPQADTVPIGKLPPRKT